jgi:hypothetical protein
MMGTDSDHLEEELSPSTINHACVHEPSALARSEAQGRRAIARKGEGGPDDSHAFGTKRRPSAIAVQA